MPSIEDHEARITALEEQASLTRQDAAAARVLAGGADRDVAAFSAKLDTQKALLEALRETQIEHGQKISGLERRFDGLERRFDGLEQRFGGLEGEMRAGFATQASGMAEITRLLTNLTNPPTS